MIGGIFCKTALHMRSRGDTHGCHQCQSRPSCMAVLTTWGRLLCYSRLSKLISESVWVCYFQQVVFVTLFQDGVTAFVTDLDFPAIKRIKNVENFLERCKYPACYHTFKYRVNDKNIIFWVVKKAMALWKFTVTLLGKYLSKKIKVSFLLLSFLKDTACHIIITCAKGFTLLDEKLLTLIHPNKMRAFLVTSFCRIFMVVLKQHRCLIQSFRLFGLHIFFSFSFGSDLYNKL